jgi:hypothetical protein
VQRRVFEVGSDACVFPPPTHWSRLRRVTGSMVRRPAIRNQFGCNPERSDGAC